MKQQYTSEQLVQRWEDRREVKNVMGKYVVSFLIKKEDTIFDTLWSKADDVCLGLNDGWFSGREALDGYYKSFVKRNIAVRDKLMALFPDQIKGATPEENYGIGVFDLRSISNCVVEVAGDGKTAKGLWYCQGAKNDVETCGPRAHWTLGWFAVDFVKEADGWKIWHMQYVNDVDCTCGQSWGKEPTVYPDLPEFAPLAEFAYPPYTETKTVREYYTPARPIVETPAIPEPYDTFADTFSYAV